MFVTPEKRWNLDTNHTKTLVWGKPAKRLDDWHGIHDISKWSDLVFEDVWLVKHLPSQISNILDHPGPSPNATPFAPEPLVPSFSLCPEVWVHQGHVELAGDKNPRWNILEWLVRHVIKSDKLNLLVPTTTYWKKGFLASEKWHHLISWWIMGGFWTSAFVIDLHPYTSSPISSPVNFWVSGPRSDIISAQPTREAGGTCISYTWMGRQNQLLCLQPKARWWPSLKG